MSLRKISKKRLAELAAQGEPLPRSTLRAKGGSRFPKMRDPEFTRWVCTLGCLLRRRGGCFGTTTPAHVDKTRAYGAADLGQVVPLCLGHHDEQEPDKRAFDRKYTLDTRAIARQLMLDYEALRGLPRL